MPHENINDVLDELESSGLVRFIFIETSPAVKKIYPVEKEFLMTENMKKELKKFMNEM